MLSWLFRRKRALSAEECFQHGTAHARAGNFEAAVEALRRAVELKPDLAEAHFNLGGACRDLGQLEPALAAYSRAADLNPGWADAHLCVGAILRELGRLEEAVAALSRAAAAGRDPAEANQELGNALTELGDWRKALEHFRAAAALRPNEARPRWAAAVAQIPAIYEGGADPEERRRAFADELGALEQWLRAAPRPNAYQAVAAHQPFYLAYQEAPNRELLARYGGLCAELMGGWQRDSGLAPRAKAPRTGPLKLGIVSAHIEDHSVWTALVRGWVAGLDPERFELYIYHLNSVRGPESRFAAGHATELYTGRRPFEAWARLIHGAGLDALIYPEIGMDATTAKLAALRLAPAQATSWGHPETSGLPTIDYFISAEGLEPPEAQANYTEKLVLLPHLGCAVSSTQSSPERFEGLDHAGPLLVCPGTPFKYAPQFDHVLVEIAKRVPGCRLVFFTGKPPALSARLRERLQRAGLDFERNAVLLPWQSPEAFRGLLRRADLVLDTLGFSGFNTALQAVESGIPIVTCEGRFMRGRFASGILRRIGLPELVVSSEEAYIEQAVALAGDPERRRALRARIQANRGVLFDDPAPVAALQDFLLSL